jgi:hypothetical protein
MKLDPGIHIVMHSVLSLKSGVTYADKLLFLQELKDLADPDLDEWLVLGDFNLIYQAQDKNNTNLNQHLMGSFKATIDALRLKEL